MNDAALRRQLADHNPWWTSPTWEQDDADLRSSTDAAFDYEPDPLRDIRPPGLYVLRGPRRVGKSVELKRAISRLTRQGVAPRTIFYCACDGFSTQDLRRLVAVGLTRVRHLPGPRYWFLDEITSVPDWSKVIKNLRDQNVEMREGCVVLSGSSARDLREATSDLAGRRGEVADSDRLLMPMNFRSFCRAFGLKHLPNATVRPKDFLTHAADEALLEIEPFWARLDDAWQLYLSIGGYPSAVNDFLRHGAVQPGFVQALWDVVRGDAIRSTSMSDTEVLALLDRLAQGMTNPVNASSVATDVGLSGGEFVNARIADLAANILVWRAHRMNDGVPNTAAQRKMYFTDPLLTHLAHQRNPHHPEVDSSKVHEQQIGLALARALERDGHPSFFDDGGVMYERTPTGAEIDFAGPELSVPFECKYIDNKWRQEALTMRSRYGSGVMATRSVFNLDGTIKAIPGAIVAWLLG